MTARIKPAERAAVVAVEQKFRLSSAVLDVIADLLVELAREEQDDEP